MTVIRGMSNEWSVMTNQCIAKRYDTHTIVKNILEIMSETEEYLKIGNILCLCAYVTDVCDDTVKKLIDGLVDYMIEKNIVMSVKFLQYLDVV